MNSVLDIPLGIELEHVFLHPFIGLHRRQFPTTVAGRYDLDKRTALPCHGSLESLAYCRLGATYSRNRLHTLSSDITSTLKLSGNLGYFQRISMKLRHTSVWTRTCFLTHECCRSHLTASHTIDSVIDENDDNILSPI